MTAPAAVLELRNTISYCEKVIEECYDYHTLNLIRINLICILFYWGIYTDNLMMANVKDIFLIRIELTFEKALR